MSTPPPQSQDHWGHSRDNNGHPDQPMAMSPARPTPQAYMSGPNCFGYHGMPTAIAGAPLMRHAFAPLNNHPTLSAGSPGPSFHNRPVSYPTVPLQVDRPTGLNPGFPTPMTILDPSPSVDLTPSTSTNPPQMFTLIPQFGNAGATRTLSSNVQGFVDTMNPQSPLPVTSNQIPLFSHAPSSYTTNNAMGSTYSPNWTAGPAPRLQEPPPDSRLGHIPDPEVHQMYRHLRLQAVLKYPKNQHPTGPVRITREERVVLQLLLYSDYHPIGPKVWGGIQLPQTRSVKPSQPAFSGRLLKFSIQVFGCSRCHPNAQPCRSCWERERRTIDPNLQPYMIDFQAESSITAVSMPVNGNDKCLKADVTFQFTCYSRHHMGWYRLILRLHDESDRLVAHGQLPYQFIVHLEHNYNDGVGECESQAHLELPPPGFTLPTQPSASVSEAPPYVPPASFLTVSVNQHSQVNSNCASTVLLNSSSGPCPPATAHQSMPTVTTPLSFSSEARALRSKATRCAAGWFDPPSQPPQAPSDSKSTPTYSLDVKVVAYEEGPQPFKGDKKWPLSEVHEPERREGDAVWSNAEKGERRFIVPVEREKLVEEVPASGKRPLFNQVEQEKLVEEVPASGKKRLLDQGVPEVSRIRDLRPGNA